MGSAFTKVSDLEIESFTENRYPSWVLSWEFGKFSVKSLKLLPRNVSTFSCFDHTAFSFHQFKGFWWEIAARIPSFFKYLLYLQVEFIL